MKQIISIFVLSFLIASCDPPRMCTEPKCLYTDVKTEFNAIIDGKMDSVINVGDTIRFYSKIPDTLITNYGNIVFGNLYESSFFSITCTKFDTITENGFSGVENIPFYKTKYGNTSNINGFQMWNGNTREFECYFVPTIKGMCFIEINGQLMDLKAKDNKEWSINPTININCNKRYNQYLSKVSGSLHQGMLPNLISKKGWYCFEVK